MKRSLLGPGLALCVALGSTSCMNQAQYREALDQAKFYQNQAFDWEYAFHQEQEAKRALEAQLADGGLAGVHDASFDRRIEDRMSRLRGMLDELGRPLGDIERFDVEGGYIYMVQDKILFSSGSADISEEGRKAIAQLASDISGEAHGRIWVRGHTDSDPVVRKKTLERFPHGNLQLSAARAIEVGAVLIGSGKLQAEDVAVVGFGPNEPIQPNDTSDNKRLNRRVEIFVSNPGNDTLGG